MLLLDTHNLYNMTSLKYPGHKIDYKKLIARLCDYHNDYMDKVEEQIAYVSNTKMSIGFAKFLQLEFNFGIVKRNKINSNFDVELTIDAMQCPTERIIICSSSKGLLPLYETLTLKGHQVFVHGIHLPTELLTNCCFDELKDVLMEPK